MNETPLVMPRRLVIQILHEAQIAQPDSIRGLVGERGGEPCSFSRSASAEDFHSRGETVWARLWSNPHSAAVPTAEEIAAGGLHLLVSLDIKGVLELRAWELSEGRPLERILKVRD